MKSPFLWSALIASAFLLGGDARADVIAVGPGAFPASSPTLTFTGLAFGTEVNGLMVNGVTFNYTVGGTPSNGTVTIDDGPGTTNHIVAPNIVSIGKNTGTLTVTLPSPANLFGYGFAILNGVTISNATSIAAFSGSTLLGSLSFAGAPDPDFTGGFAGIQSTVPFDRLALTFNSTAAPAFAVDNIVYASTVPEPATVLFLVIGCVVLILGQRLAARQDRRSKHL
jgi:hypothetical protein